MELDALEKNGTVSMNLKINERLYARYQKRQDETYGAKANDKLDLEEATRVFSAESQAELSLAEKDGTPKQVGN